MTTLILLTPHAGGLGYYLDQTSNYSSKKDNVLMNTTETGNLFGQIWIAGKQCLPIVNTFHWNGSSSGYKSYGNQGCNNHASNTCAVND
jgi:hypothetical protein